MPKMNVFCCKQCGAQVKRAGATQFCSHTCAMTFRHARDGHNQPITFICGWCSATVTKTPHAAGFAKYCSRACAAAQGRANYVRTGKVSVVCDGCGEAFDKWRNDASVCTLNFHNRECRRAYHAAHIRDPGTLRNMVWDRDGGKCIVCGGWRFLEVHHINGIHSDSRLENMALFCKKCHIHAHVILNDGVLPNGRRSRAHSITPASASS